MNGLDLFVDTNILIDLSEGKRQIANYIDGNRIHISIITEIELLGWLKITQPHKDFFSMRDLAFEKIKSLNLLIIE